MSALAPARPNHYVKRTPQEVDRALLELAMVGGNSVRARERLLAEGLDIPETTLRDWRLDTHAERYRLIAEEHGKKIEQVIVQQAKESAIAAGQVEIDMIESLSNDIDKLDAKDKAAALRNVTTSKAINVDKFLALTGRPTQITEHRNAADILNALQAHRIVDVVDSTATEIPTPPPDTAAINAREGKHALSAASGEANASAST